MNTFIRFFYEFISIFFDGVVMIFKGIVEGFSKMFNFPEYSKIISNYGDALTSGEKVMMWIVIAIFVLIFFLIIFFIIMKIRKLFRKFDNNFNKEDLLEEISDLNQQVARLMKEKDELMAMKVSQLG